MRQHKDKDSGIQEEKLLSITSKIDFLILGDADSVIEEMEEDFPKLSVFGHSIRLKKMKLK